MLQSAEYNETKDESDINGNMGVFETLPLTVNIHQSVKSREIDATKLVSNKGWVSFSSVTPVLSEKMYPYTITPYSVVVVDMIFAPYSTVAMSTKGESYGAPEDIINMKRAVNFYVQSTSADFNKDDSPKVRIEEKDFVNIEYDAMKPTDGEDRLLSLEATPIKAKKFLVGNFRKVNAKISIEKGTEEIQTVEICWDPTNFGCISSIPYKDGGLSITSTPSGNKMGLT